VNQNSHRRERSLPEEGENFRLLKKRGKTPCQGGRERETESNIWKKGGGVAQGKGLELVRLRGTPQSPEKRGKEEESDPAWGGGAMVEIAAGVEFRARREKGKRFGDEQGGRRKNSGRANAGESHVFII